MSETPRMKAAQMAAIEHGTGDVYRVGCDIERELNAAYPVPSLAERERLIRERDEARAERDEAAKVVEKALSELGQVARSRCALIDRIKRLEEAGDAMEKYIHDQTNTRFIICAIRWREAKEDKL